jgi:tetratricopeptide (TPR) repeat protein
LDSVQRRGDEVMAEAINWLESVKRDRFFSWIHLYDPHTPFDPPEPYRSQYEGVPWGLYDGEVAFLDSLMGQLLDWLDANQLAENTIVAFIGDHGESLGQHKEITHGFFIYDATVAVPFILKTPHKQLEGRRVSAQVRTIDLMPTLLDLLGFAIPERVQGASLLDLSSGRADDLELIAYSESLYPRHHYGWSDLKSLRDGTLHYIASPNPELYDISKDPQETTNLASERPEDVEAFEQELQEILELYSVEGIDERGPETLDPETQAQLAALGYLGGATKVDIDPTAPLADPKDKIGLFNLIKQAGSDSSEGRIDDAFTKIRRVLDEDPEILEAHLILGNLYNKRGENDKAIEAYKEALARDPEYLSALHSMAATYLTMGRREEAEAGFRRLLDLDPRNSRALFMLAEIHSVRKDYTEAVELLNRAQETGAERAPTFNLMAECLIELDRLDEAEAAVRKAIELQGDLRTAHFNLALIREASGDPAGAIRAYETEIEISPQDHKSHFNLAKLYAGAGNLQKTIEHFRKSIEIDPSFAEGHLYLAKLYLDQGDLNQAMELAQKANGLDPEPSLAPMGHFILADVYNRMGRLQDAEREVAIARRLQSNQ